MSTVLELVKDIRDNFTQVASSSKDEESIMRAMLNDKTYVVGVYDRNGKVGEFCPGLAARDLAVNIISGAAKMPREEALVLADNYVFKKDDAIKMIDISKEFINTYVGTKRKLPLGGREKMNVALSIKEVEESVKTYPKKVGIDENGKSVFENASTPVPAHESLRVHSKCPEYLK